jgi:hypothetical protein
MSCENIQYSVAVIALGCQGRQGLFVDVDIWQNN